MVLDENSRWLIGGVVGVVSAAISGNGLVLAIGWRVARHLATEKARNERVEAVVTKIQEGQARVTRALFARVDRHGKRIDDLYVHIGIRRAPSQPDLEDDAPNGALDPEPGE